ncbi:MAG: hypothetical protein EPN20_15145 [Magnetospirillum sp.]|nr:MAG: hypothetical protein EPN20_15145 [Magnetospirillum sp.]
MAQPASHGPTGEVVSTEAAPFISPVVNFNYQAGIAVLEFRDGSTGEVTEQFPSKKVVQEYIRHGAVSQDVTAQAPSSGEHVAAPSPTGDGPAAPVAAAVAPAPPVQAAAAGSSTVRAV